ncbi:tyrosine-type recombinase/integrase [Rubellimicrobium mesophilum]|uniref:tyrosine-type recombinase/integrase n=1 Tax=Rubellimicrobium mesophilum TaxID=1123067 RepID=UPI00068680C8|nr:tyrosine-type recombinase/integrase [Rubellimicrobium mesophilum]
MPHRRSYPNVSSYRDRHGQLRFRYRKNGKSVDLGTDYGSEDFIRRHQEAVSTVKVLDCALEDHDRTDTIRSLVRRLRPVLLAGNNLADRTKQNLGYILTAIEREYGDRSVKGMTSIHVREFMAKKAKTPAAANHRLRVLAQVLDLGVELAHLQSNPAREVNRFQLESDGLHTWTEQEISQYLAWHPSGTVPHTAMMLMLWTGAATVDAVKLGWKNIIQTDRGEKLVYVRRKTAKAKDHVEVVIPIMPKLREVLELCPRDQATFLQNKLGQQRSAKGLSHSMRTWCNRAGLSHCSAHGLRKAIARRLAEAGVGAWQIAAITGHRTLSEVQRYVQAANRTAMAELGMSQLDSIGPSLGDDDATDGRRPSES